jgi:hypothetical protein
MTSPELETRRPPSGPGFLDVVSFAFGDIPNGIFGLARIALDGEGRATAMAALFAGGDLVGAEALEGEAGEAVDWAEIAVGDVRAGTEEPLARWPVAFAGEEGGFELTFQALATPARFPAEGAPGRVARLESYEQLCRVQGRVTSGGAAREIDCLGQRGHAWGAPGWESLESVRSLSAWLGPESAVFALSARPRGELGHDEDAIAAVLLDGYGETAHMDAVADARISTTYDGEDRERRVGLELLVAEEDEFPRRAAGEALRAVSLEAGGLRVDSSFLLWRLDGRAGVGRAERVRRA